MSLTNYPVSSPFNSIDSVHKTPHTGIDIATPVGTPIEVPNDGVVQKVQDDPLLGNCIFINLDNNMQVVYGHLSQVNVSHKQRVTKGEIVGLTGGVKGAPGAGNSTGPHVHISMWDLKTGTRVDPTPYLGVDKGSHESAITAIEACFVCIALFILLMAPLRRKWSIWGIGGLGVLFLLLSWWLGGG